MTYSILNLKKIKSPLNKYLTNNNMKRQNLKAPLIEFRSSLIKNYVTKQLKNKRE